MSIGPTQDTITLCLSAATVAQLRAAARAIDEELDKRTSVIMNALEDPDSLLNQELADALDARELDVVEVRPVGKGVRHNVLDALSPETWTEKVEIRKCRRCGDEHTTLNRVEESGLCWDCATGLSR